MFFRLFLVPVFIFFSGVNALALEENVIVKPSEVVTYLNNAIHIDADYFNTMNANGGDACDLASSADRIVRALQEIEDSTAAGDSNLINNGHEKLIFAVFPKESLSVIKSVRKNWELTAADKSRRCRG